MPTLTLTDDQQDALDAFVRFLTDPTETVFVLSGYSGTGKTTLVNSIIAQLPSFLKVAKLLNPQIDDYGVSLTATTNKAAEAFSHITGGVVTTIHSFLGLRVETNYRTNTTQLTPSGKTPPEKQILFIDEASYIDKNLLAWIFKLTKNCKIVFMGDPAQLTPVKSQTTPVFDANFSGAKLSKVVRQAEGNPIIALSTQFRETVSSGEFFQFVPDGESVQHMDRESFNQAVISEFTRPDWKYKDSKFLAWTNKTVVDYNHAINDHVKGVPHFQIGDYAVCNKFVSAGRKSIKTDQLVCITAIAHNAHRHSVAGSQITLDYHMTFFFPDSLGDKKEALKLARSENRMHIVQEIEDQWIDLRAAYACTINKAQGSTFDRVFIDLDDVSKCNMGDQIARMLYVAVSRARYQVILTGDLV